MRRIVIAALAVALVTALSPAGAHEPSWHLEIRNLEGSMGVAEIFTFDPGRLVVTLRGSEAGNPTEEIARRSLSAAENKIVRDAILRFSNAGLRPLYENPAWEDGYDVSVTYVAPGARKGSVQVRNVLVPEFNALISSIMPVLPPMPAGMLPLVPYSDPSRRD